MGTDYIYKEETNRIIAAFYEVYNALGYGFLEKVYQNALYQELIRRGFRCEAQRHIEVYFKGCKVGDYFPDIIVNDRIILELKTVEALCPEHEAQLINYLRSTEIEVGLLLNFGLRPQVCRRIFTNDRKSNLCKSV
ncbi:GxxExxY protein [uncultured Bacteroides sp.]|uniref:GxxExxY protein n=1 Tax=uncultured Bacteroides sp. TaxID=162156 RepID=UPI0026174039|nr:GxxExxY protein [uncultured Bacteroides sp.]